MEDGLLTTVVGAARIVGVRVCHLLFERGQADTSATAARGSAGEAVGRRPYHPSGWFFVRRAFRGLRVRPDDVFIDLGSGMGRVVCQVARQFRFQRVLGVEIDPALAAVAEENVRRLGTARRAGQIELVTADLRTHPVPDDVTFVYLFNPFGPDILSAVLDSLRESILRTPREVTIIYANPKYEQVIVDAGGFRRVRTSNGWPGRDDTRIAIFRHELQ
ncbi:SAM-dependent methyltransferase [Euzebya rosea]|uniref:SAM-dependent methyltransferase n=1 Tax=Euzebya rosea TaxID=2052804 RepID=UPI001F0C019A|nr:class I SAM-dependent methyltransferase [Euzebya rosea]